MIKNNKVLIESRLTEIFSPTYLDVIDESNEHIGHAGYQGGGRHFAVIIAAESLEKLSRVEAHRQIYQALNDVMGIDVHALRIKILK